MLNVRPGKVISVAHGAKGDDTSRTSVSAIGESPSNPVRVGSGIRRNAYAGTMLDGKSEMPIVAWTAGETLAQRRGITL